MCCVLEERGITTDRQTGEIEICMHTTHLCKHSSFLHTNTVLCIGSVCIYVQTDTTFVVTDNTHFVLLFCSCFLLVSVCEKIIHGEFDCTDVAQEGHRERKDRLFV
jgi:hypothetical protein